MPARRSSDPAALMQAQRALRGRLFEGPQALDWRPGRELAAQLLLYLDEPQACWRLTTDWLRETLDADRVDGGFGGYGGPDGHRGGARAGGRDYVVMAEAQRPGLGLPPVLGRHFRASASGLRAVWLGADLTLIPDVSQEPTIADDLRQRLQTVGTRAKLALPVRDGATPVGLVCADWHRVHPRWPAGTVEALAGFAREALGPLLATAAGLAVADAGAGAAGTAAAAAEAEVPAAGRLATLTPAEARLAALVAQGLSYKEMARVLDRALPTIDHQLRSIRAKLGVRSTARLTRLLCEAAAGERP
ncbi:MAG: hypothetical protein RLY78_1176 [Pseudomonadota bacterium]